MWEQVRSAREAALLGSYEVAERSYEAALASLQRLAASAAESVADRDQILRVRRPPAGWSRGGRARGREGGTLHIEGMSREGRAWSAAASRRRRSRWQLRSASSRSSSANSRASGRPPARPPADQRAVEGATGAGRAPTGLWGSARRPPARVRREPRWEGRVLPRRRGWFAQPPARPAPPAPPVAHRRVLRPLRMPGRGPVGHRRPTRRSRASVNSSHRRAGKTRPPPPGKRRRSHSPLAVGCLDVLLLHSQTGSERGAVEPTRAPRYVPALDVAVDRSRRLRRRLPRQSFPSFPLGVQSESTTVHVRGLRAQGRPAGLRRPGCGASEGPESGREGPVAVPRRASRPVGQQQEALAEGRAVVEQGLEGADPGAGLGPGVARVVATRVGR